MFDLESSGHELEEVVAKDLGLQGRLRSSKLAPAIAIGKRNLKWLDFINSQRLLLYPRTDSTGTGA